MSILIYKAKLFAALFVGALLCASGSSAAVVRADVGSNDTYLGECTQGLTPSLANEVICLNAFGAGTDAASVDKSVNADNPFEELGDEAGVYAMDLTPGYTGGYFLLRTGNIGGTHKQYSFVFQNNSEDGYAVINLSLFNIILNGIETGLTMDNIGKVSHISSIVGVSPVPLPAAVWMMLTALGGMFGFKKFSLHRRKTA